MVLWASGKKSNLISKKEERRCLLGSLMDLENKPAIQEQAPPPVSQGTCQVPYHGGLSPCCYQGACQDDALKQASCLVTSLEMQEPSEDRISMIFPYFKYTRHDDFKSKLHYI